MVAVFCDMLHSFLMAGPSVSVVFYIPPLCGLTTYVPRVILKVQVSYY